MPKVYQSQCQPILNRVRALLAGYSRSSILSLLRDINQITNAKEAKLSSDSNLPAYISHALTITTLFRKKASTEILGSRDLYSYYAIIALALIAYINMVQNGRKYAINKDVFDSYIQLICEKAENCVLIAEDLVLANQERTVEELKIAC